MSVANVKRSGRSHKAQSDLSAAEEIRTKLLKTLPHYRQQDEAYQKLAQDGYASKIMATDNTWQSRLLRRRLPILGEQ